MKIVLLPLEGVSVLENRRVQVYFKKCSLYWFGLSKFECLEKFRSEHSYHSRLKFCCSFIGRQRPRTILFSSTFFFEIIKYKRCFFDIFRKTIENFMTWSKTHPPIYFRFGDIDENNSKVTGHIWTTVVCINS